MLLLLAEILQRYLNSTHLLYPTRVRAMTGIYMPQDTVPKYVAPIELPKYIVLSLVP